MIALCAAIFAVAGSNQLLPIDEGPKDKQFLEFRTNLIAAIKKKNYAYVQSRIVDDIKWSFGGGGGRKEMMEAWASREGEVGFYDELLRVLQLGGQFGFYDDPKDKSFTAPYSFSAWPDDYDAFEYVVAVRDGVPVYETPDESADKTGSLSYDIVKVVYGGDYVKGWHEIELPVGSSKTGWVQDGPVRSPIDYRAIFFLDRGSWYMRMFIAGD